MAYYLFDGKETLGPFEASELLKRPGFNAESLVCTAGATSADAWKAAGSFPEIVEALRPKEPPPPAPTAAPTPSDAHIAASLDALINPPEVSQTPQPPAPKPAPVAPPQVPPPAAAAAPPPAPAQPPAPAAPPQASPPAAAPVPKAPAPILDLKVEVPPRPPLNPPVQRPQEPLVPCPKCAYRNPASARFCNQCGMHFGAAAPKAAPKTAAPSPGPSASSPTSAPSPARPAPTPASASNPPTKAVPPAAKEAPPQDASPAPPKAAPPLAAPAAKASPVAAPAPAGAEPAKPGSSIGKQLVTVTILAAGGAYAYIQVKPYLWPAPGPARPPWTSPATPPAVSTHTVSAAPMIPGAASPSTPPPPARVEKARSDAPRATSKPRRKKKISAAAPPSADVALSTPTASSDAPKQTPAEAAQTTAPAADGENLQEPKAR